MSRGQRLESFQIIGQMPNQLIVIPDDVVRCFGYDDGNIWLQWMKNLGSNIEIKKRKDFHLSALFCLF